MKRCGRKSKKVNSTSDINEYDAINDAIRQRVVTENEQRYKQFRSFVRECQQGAPKALKHSAKINNMNNLVTLEEEDAIVSCPEKIEEKFRSFYANLYKSEVTDENEMCRWVNEYQNTTTFPLEECISINEVEKAINRLNNLSAPGLDGLTAPFYKMFKKEIAPTLCEMFNESILQGKLPLGLNLAVIKLLPKIDRPITVGDFRPISLINTDAKILAHILAERMKVTLSQLITGNQHAYLTGRQINVAIRRINDVVGKRLSNGKCLMNIDFAKAFDTIDRCYIFKLLEKLRLSAFTLNAVRTLYDNTTAVIEINGYLSQSFRIHRGVRQGCPLSALLFNLALDPLIQKINSLSHNLFHSHTKVIAYADDMTCCPTTDGVPLLINLLANFGEATQLKINLKKTEILTDSALSNLRCVQSTQILGVQINVEQKSANLRELLAKAISKHQPKLNLCVTFKARADAINTFIVPKFLHAARHQAVTVGTLAKCQSDLLRIIYPNAKYDIKSAVLHQDKKDGGIGFVYLPLRVLVAKLKDFLAAHGDTFPLIIDTTTRSLLKHSLVKLHVSDAGQCLIICNRTNASIPLSAKFKELYAFVIESKFPRSEVDERLIDSVNKYNCQTTELKKFCANIWLSDYLFPHEKNLFYRLAFNSIRDKQSKWLDNLVDSPICSFCDEEFETNDHLIFECKKLETAKTKLNLKNWRDIFCKKLDLKHRFVSSVLFGSLKCTPSSSLNYIDYFLEMES